MSLILWLPLCGSLENKGISSSVMPSYTGSWGTGGKIHDKCALSNFKVTYTIPELVDVTEFSIAYWIYIDSSVAIQNWNDIWAINSIVGSTSAIIRDEFQNAVGLHQLCMGKDTTVGGNTNNYYNISTDTSLAKDTWVHIILTKNSTKVSVYINGIWLKDINCSAFESSPQKLTGTVIIGNTTSAAGKLNDFRIYDHCLSPLEVNEISQGLVVHYELNGWSGPIGNNILTGTNIPQDTMIAGNSVNNSTSLWGYGSGGNGVCTITTLTDPPINSIVKGFKIENNTSGNRDWIQRDQPYKSGITYTISWYARGKCTVLSRSWNVTDGKSMQSKSYTLDSTDWTYFTHTFTANAEMESDSCTYQLGLSGAGNIEFCALKMEIGSTATAWTPAPLEDGTDTTKVIDTSGYGNDMKAVGNITMTTDSSRYGNAFHFINGSYLINPKTSNSGYLPTDAITVNVWAKWDVYAAQLISCTEGGGWNFESSPIRFPIYVNGVGYKTATSTKTTTSLAGSWHMYTGTFDRTNVKIYIDGVLEGTTATGSTNPIKYAAAALCVAAEAQSATAPNNSAFVGDISDVRIYATALSAEDIMTLYHTSAQIDNLGGIHGFEFVEDNSKISAKENGQVLESELDEINFNNNAQFMKDTNNIVTRNIIEK